MDLLTSEKSISRRPIYAPNSVVLVPLIAPTVRRRFNSKWAALSVCLIASFAGGFGASSLLRPRNLPQEIRTQVTDFHIVIPDGQTIVTVFNPQTEQQEIGRLIVQREGDTIQGIPQTERHIAARARLSADDAVFFVENSRVSFSQLTRPGNAQTKYAPGL